MNKIKKIVETEKEMFENAAKSGPWAILDYFFLYVAGGTLGVLLAYFIGE